MKFNLLSKIFFAVVLAFTLSTFLYFSFGNIYSSKILNFAAFSAQFDAGIYQYRVLSSYILFWIYDLLSAFSIDYSVFKLHFFEDEGEPQMYIALYILNTVFLVLTSVVLVLITNFSNFIATETEKILIITVAVFAMVFTQFVIVPYDVSSYFFLVLFYYFLLKYSAKNTAFNLMILMLILLTSAFNRESAALSLSLSGTVLYAVFGFSKKIFVPLLILTAAFIAVYLGMRLSAQNFTTHDGNLLLQNFSDPKNFLGLLFWLIFFVFTLLLAKDQRSRNYILIFHVLSTPYILMCFYSGIIYEVRLYVPLLLTSMLLARTELRRKSIN